MGIVQRGRASSVDRLAYVLVPMLARVECCNGLHPPKFIFVSDVAFTFEPVTCLAKLAHLVFSERLLRLVASRYQPTSISNMKYFRSTVDNSLQAHYVSSALQRYQRVDEASATVVKSRGRTILIAHTVVSS